MSNTLAGLGFRALKTISDAMPDEKRGEAVDEAFDVLWDALTLLDELERK